MKNIYIQCDIVREVVVEIPGKRRTKKGDNILQRSKV